MYVVVQSVGGEERGVVQSVGGEREVYVVVQSVGGEERGVRSCTVCRW